MVLALFLFPMLITEIIGLMPVNVELQSNQFYLTDLAIDHYTQQYGRPRVNRAVDGATLTVRGQQYKNGIGTHAASEIFFKMPADADSLEFVVGIDDEAGGGGSVRFIVATPEETLWKSDVVFGNKKPQAGKVYIGGQQTIILKADADGDNAYDHADWLNVIVTKRK